MSPRLRQINEIGIGMAGVPNERMVDLRVYAEGATVQIWVETGTLEVMQYLTPSEAMSFAKAFERCAIQALKDSA